MLIVYMKSGPPRSVFNFSSLLLSFLLRVAMFVVSHSMESQDSVLRGVGSGSVSDRSAIARHEASFLAG